MAAKAHLMVTADANIKPFKAKMAEAKKDGINVAEEISQKNKEAVSALLDYASPVMMLVAAVGAIGAAFTKVAEHGDELRKSARELGVSAGTMAELNARAKSANIPLEEMNDLFGQLKAGKITLDQLRDAMGGFGDRAKYASETMKNFTAIQMSRNKEVLGNLTESLSGKIAGGVLRYGTFGYDKKFQNVLAPYIQSAAEAGMDASQIRAGMRREGFTWASLNPRTTQARNKEINAFIESAVASVETRRRTEGFESESKVMQNLLKEIGDLDEAVKQYNENFDKKVSRDEFERRSKPKEETAFEKSVRLGKENMKAQEAEKKAEAESAKKERDRAKIEIGYAYTKGGGMLAGLNYGPGMRSAEEESRKRDSGNLDKIANGMREQTEETRKTNEILQGD